MTVEYRIHPPIGVARVGNSTEFYLSPVTIGGRPIECGQYGDEILDAGKPKYVKKFKDEQKRIKRQAAKFRIFKHDLDKPDSEPTEIDLTNKKEIKGVKWTVHLANKKSAWYHFNEFYGDLLVGAGNTYENHRKDGVHKRNENIEDPKERRKLIIDFGPRTLDSPHFKLPFQKDNTVPVGYPATLPYHQLESEPKYGKAVRYLGEIITDSKCNLIVLGGFGNAGGDVVYSSFAGGDGWYDDISDGPIICELELANGDKIILDAWVIVGPPKFAPELVNITTLDDIMFDVAVRYNLKGAPKIYDAQKWPETDGFDPNFKPNFERDIEPIVKRIGHYRWVANVPSMMDFCMPSFDMKDSSEENKKNRQKYFSYFRKPGKNEWGKGGEAQILFKDNDYVGGIPLMPLNSGSNAVENSILDKFVTLSQTQYFFLRQWADGKFTTGKSSDLVGLIPLSHADTGNSVGSPLCPGVEVTFSVRNPSIYSAAYRIKHKTKDSKYYFEHGLDPEYEETAPLGMEGGGCEPGDLTKRMADPWMSDLFECNIQHVNFADIDKNKDPETGLEPPPLYYAYWWPPQSPWDVILGVTDPEEDDPIKRKEMIKEELEAAGISAGQQVNYIRGIHSHMQMVRAWSYLGFIVNQNEGDDRDEYPYFVEKERNHNKFEVVALAAANKVNLVDPSSTKFVAEFYLKEDIGEYT